MAQPLTVQNLIKCLQEKDKFKGTSVYLHEVNQFNEKIYDIFNDALVAILLQKHNNYMAKLLALRLFKDLIISANFTLIDGLDEKIEDEIVKVAQYNKKSKEVSRGANYFIETQNLKKDADIQKLGSSYVLLASQIILVLAKWCPNSEDGEETRFVEYFKQLSAIGVSFPKENQFNFFKKDEEQKFRKNYGKWMKWYVQKVKQEENEETVKQIKQNSDRQPLVDNKKEENIKPKEIGEPKSQQIQKQPVIEQNPASSNIDVKNQKVKQQPEVKESKIESKIVTNIVDSDQKYKKLEQALQTCTKDKNILVLKYQAQLTQLKQQNHSLENGLATSKQSFSLAESQKISLQQENQLKKSQIQKLLLHNKQVEDKLNAMIKNDVKPIPPLSKDLSPLECYQIKVSPPKGYQDLQQQNEALMEALDAAQKCFLQKKQSLQQELTLVKQQNKKLSQSLLANSKQMQEYKKNQNLQHEIVQNIIRQDSLFVQDQPRIQSKAFTNAINQPQPPKKHTKNHSVSDFFKEQSKQAGQNYYPEGQNRQKRLKKTQSQQKLSTIKDSLGFSNTGFSYQCKAQSNKLNKTNQQFYRNPQEFCNSLVTYYPFLQGYFQPVPQESTHFKHFCLNLVNSKGPFYQNQLVAISIQKINSSKYIISILNKVRVQLKMKLLSGHYSFVIEGQKTQRVAGLTFAQFEIRADSIDLNLRYPIISIIIGNQRLSLASSNPYDRTLHIPLPITLLDFCKINRDKERDWLGDKKIAKYCSNQVALSKCNSNVQNSFPEFKISNWKNGVMIKAGLELMGCDNGKVLVEMEQNQLQISVGVMFCSESQNSLSFAKVIMQVLLYLIQK